jgi:hypothetical protein
MLSAAPRTAAARSDGRTAGKAPGTFEHLFEGVKVITNANGGVITVIPK